MFRTQNLCPGSKNVFDSRQKHFYFDFRWFGMFNEVIDNKNKNFSKRNLCFLRLKTCQFQFEMDLFRRANVFSFNEREHYLI